MCVCVCVCVFISLCISGFSPEGHKQLITVVLACSGCYNKIPYSGWLKGFPGKESACNAENPSLTPGSGRSAGEGIDYPLQCS